MASHYQLTCGKGGVRAFALLGTLTLVFNKGFSNHALGAS